jgi:UDP-N-acetylmuramate dehydrogenase
MKSQELKIQENISLAPFTTYRIGGPARYFAEVSAEEALLEALQYAKDNNLKIFVLGGGSNILISDDGFDGLVIRLSGSKSPIGLLESNQLECWAGDSLSGVVNFCRDNSLAGLEWAAGIPGSVGGAIRGNAGAYGGEIRDCVESVKILNTDNLQITTYKKHDCAFAYRSSAFKQNQNLIVLSCVLKLEKGDKDEIEAKIKEVIGKRTQKIPTDPSPGSFFQNPTVTDKNLIAAFEKDMETVCRGNKLPAGWLIDEAGLRGKRIGGVMVSDKHANFVINTGGATAQDVVMLASFIKMKVRDELGVQLKEEIQYVGF